MAVNLTFFQGRAGDHNDLAIPGARALAMHLARHLGLTPVQIGTPEPALNTDWYNELRGAKPALQAMQQHVERVLAQGDRLLTATSRCAVSLATLPAVATFHPDACVVWFDAHADLNTPEATTSGYLGGMALSGPAGLWTSGLGNGLRLENIILVGQRDVDPWEAELIARRQVTYIPPGKGLCTRLRDAIRQRPVYLHLDCDVLEPGIVPTDYVHSGGLSLTDLHQASQILAASQVVGLEIAEFQHVWHPGGDPVSPAPLVAALAPLLANMGREARPHSVA